MLPGRVFGKMTFRSGFNFAQLVSPHNGLLSHEMSLLRTLHRFEGIPKVLSLEVAYFL